MRRRVGEEVQYSVIEIFVGVDFGFLPAEFFGSKFQVFENSLMIT